MSPLTGCAAYGLYFVSLSLTNVSNYSVSHALWLELVPYAIMCSMRKNLKNYRTKLHLPRILADIQALLVAHGARQLLFDYGEAGQVRGVAFTIPGPRGLLSIRLPARPERVAALVYGDAPTPTQRQQAEAIAW